MSASLYAKLFFLWLAVFIDLLGFGIVLPILPFLATDLISTSLSDTTGSLHFIQAIIFGTLIASFSLMQFIMAPIWGSISDRIGRRPVLLIGLAGPIVGFTLFGLSDQLWVLFISRLIAGAFTSATLTVANAYTADITTTEQRQFAFGILTSGFGLGFILGPVLGGLLIQIQIPGLLRHAIPGFFSAFLCLINLIGAVFVLKESLPAEIKANPPEFTFFALNGIRKLKKYKSAIPSVAFYALVTFAYSQYITAFSQYVPEKNRNLGETELGIIFAVSGLVLFITQIAGIRILSKLTGERNILIIGTACIITGFSLVVLTSSLIGFILISVPLAFGIGLVIPTITTLVSKAVAKNIQGQALGINQGLSSLTRTIGPLVAGFLFGININLPFYTGALVLLLSVLFLIFLYRPTTYISSSNDLQPSQ